MRTHLLTIIFVLGFASGILTEELSLQGSALGVAALLLFLVNCVVLYSFRKKYNPVLPVAMVIFSLSFFIGIARMQLVEAKVPFVCDTSCEISAKVVTAPEAKDAYQVFDVEVSESKALRIRVRLPLYPEYKAGDKLTLFGKIREPKNIYPHEDKKAFDYRRYLELNDVGSEMYYPKVMLAENGELTLKERMMGFKDNLVGRIDTHVAPPVSALASGMLFGNASLPEDILKDFRTSGLSHIIVLSGFNIAILISALFLVLMFLPLLARVIVSAVVVTFFVLMVGGEPSVIRATLMAFIALLALMVGRSYVARQALLISLFLIALYNPATLLHDVSLHLSFLATAGIVYMEEGARLLTRRVFPFLREILSTSLSAYIATLPYVLYVFGSMSLYAIFANMLVLPLVPLMMFLSGLVVVMSFVSSPLSYIVGYATTFVGGFIIQVAHTVSLLPWSGVSVSIGFKMTCAFYGLIGLGYVFLVTRKKDETRITSQGETMSDIISY